MTKGRNKKNTKGQMGRPTKEFVEDEFIKLCALQCTQEEMCYFFETSDKTLSRWCKETFGMTFTECIKTFGVDGKISLRRWQMEKARKGNSAMLIWLGKQHLGQSEKVEQMNTNVQVPLEDKKKELKKFVDGLDLDEDIDAEVEEQQKEVE